MKRIVCHKMLMMSLMVLITVLGLGKISLAWITPAPQAVAQVQPVVKQAEVPKNQAKEAQNTSWLNQDMIPSVTAAETTPLKEEKPMMEPAQGKYDALVLREKHKALQDKERALEAREAVVQEAEKRAQAKIDELLKLEARIQSILAEEESIKDKKIKRLTAVYEGMKADRAAPVIAQMDLDIVVRIFSRMSEKQVGKILSYLKPKQAVVISQALTRRIASVK